MGSHGGIFVTMTIFEHNFLTHVDIIRTFESKNEVFEKFACICSRVNITLFMINRKQVELRSLYLEGLYSLKQCPLLIKFWAGSDKNNFLYTFYIFLKNRFDVNFFAILIIFRGKKCPWKWNRSILRKKVKVDSLYIVRMTKNIWKN